ncbi:hypothetical protein EOS93_25230 [Rhizobium sp. RMa-01]|uniref:hypothetical protein n=1 Tax=unclassified Rhizobium TaxID=2613769 RepID=UPI0008D95F62|nr:MULTISPECIES: hypothetical protein [unclassified Rhizobium]OHV24937.1 hypothetical protein BBJ66_22605 [Rhizobium sp. RSm-3]RVU08356.1 hypothetical protein EOS93_25230 [Rhizobium sp. RMa-01]
MCTLQRQNGFYSAMAGMGDKNGNPEFASAVRSKMVNEPAASSAAAAPALAPAGRQASRQTGTSRQNAGTALGGSTILTSGGGPALTAAAADKKTLLGQ